ncbi:hypothetical protein BAE44_0006294 [Dichanthelium oligosanthes]|uniref:RanBP2-type domain-containing protein n=1 Tax=Dichanthelium oligosanthes TaxID=888268 RepID=A0A1E5W5P8_9POAL|nr:hypothetical protein BAE44_0006294 [Dichanthelium oligosanthes]
MASSSSKLLNLSLSSSLLRSCRLASTSILPITSRRNPGSLLSLHFCSAAPAAVNVAADPAEAAVSASHPWPEWSEFLDKLRAKGYFQQAVRAGEGAAGDGEAAASDSAVGSEDTYPFRDLNRVKNACLKFARERYDLLSSIPKEDIKAIVKWGCPNINRKPVNCAKRLREFVDVKEEDACRVCKFRGSCDRACETPKAENEVRTADVVRILLEYAIDTNSLSGENSVNKSVQESARKLLSKLIILSDTAIDPSVPKPVFQTSSKNQSSTKLSDKRAKGRDTTATEMKMGDWLCTKCDFVNFRRNRICKKCNQDRPEDDTQDNQLGLRNTRGAGNSRSFDSNSDDDTLPYKGLRKHVSGIRPNPNQRRTAAKSRGGVDLEDFLLTAKRRSFLGR